MGLGITIKERRSVKIGTAEVTILSAQKGACRMIVEAPEDVMILKKTERNLILETLKLLRERDQTHIDEAIKKLTYFVQANYIEEGINS